MRTRKLPAPPGLDVAGKKLWDDITRQVADDGLLLEAPERRILSDACRAADDVERLAEALAGAPVVVTGSTGQQIPNRLFDEVRKGRALVANLLKQLNLNPAEVKAGTGSATTSAMAREAAAVRWLEAR